MLLIVVTDTIFCIGIISLSDSSILTILLKVLTFSTSESTGIARCTALCNLEYCEIDNFSLFILI